MPTTITIILPAQLMDDTASIDAGNDTRRTLTPSINGSEGVSTDENTVFVSRKLSEIHSSTTARECLSLDTRSECETNLEVQRSGQLPFGNRMFSSCSTAQTRHTLIPTSVAGNGRTKHALQQEQHQMTNGDSLATPVVLDPHAQGTRPTSVAGQASKVNWRYPHSSRTNDNTHLAFSSTYDIDLEYEDIMVKALHSYSRHRHRESDRINLDNQSVHENGLLVSRPDQVQNLKLTNDTSLETPCLSVRHGENVNDGQITNEPWSVFRLSRCQLKYNEIDDEDKHINLQMNRMRTAKSSSFKPRTTVTLHAPPLSDGILVDCAGRMFTNDSKLIVQEKLRPWSALPCKYSNFFKLSRKQPAGEGNESIFSEKSDWHTENDLQGQQHPLGSSPINNIIPTTTATRTCFPRSSASHRQHVHTLKLGNTMSGDQAIPRSMTYQRRNQTTHSWYDTKHMMSQSLPSTSFLHRQYLGGILSSGTSPKTSKDATSFSEKGSPAGKSSSFPRPSSSYSYDGGLFVGAHSGPAEYFVIHPDWVSEAMTIKRLSISAKTPPRVVPKSISRRGQGRRCMSAPPSKFRNPITWDQSESIDIPKPKNK